MELIAVGFGMRDWEPSARYLLETGFNKLDVWIPDLESLSSIRVGCVLIGD